MSSACVPSCLLLALVCVVPNLSADPQDLPPDPKELIQKLGAEDPEVREQATEALRKLGQQALAELEAASKAGDPEVAWRARKLLEDLQDAAKFSTKSESRKKGKSAFSFRIQIVGPSSVSIVEDADGKVTVKEQVTENGEEVARVYEASSWQEFREKYPDVVKKYGIEEASPRIGPVPRKFRDPWEAWREGQDPFEDFLRDLRKNNREMERWFRRFSERIDPGEDAAPERQQRRKSPEPKKGVGEGLALLKPLGLEFEYLEPAVREQLGVEEGQGVLVAKVSPGGLGEKWGLQEWDVVLSAGGEPVETGWDLRRKISRAAPVGEIPLEILRSGKQMTLRISREAAEKD